MARKKLKLIGKTTSRKATAAEMTRHRATVAESKRTGEIGNKKKKKKTGLSALVEKDTFAGKAARVITSPKTTIALGATLATLGLGSAALAGGTAARTAGAGSITRTGILTKDIIQKAGKKLITTPISREGKRHTAFGMTKFKEIGKQTLTRFTPEKIIRKAGESITVQRAIVGKPANTGVTKLFSAASRFATNKKSAGLTSSMLRKAGMTIGGLAVAGTLIGTYPFAEFELAEATDKIGIAIFRASSAGDEEEVVRLVQQMDEMLDENVWEQVVNKIPFANVMQSVRKNIAAAQVSAESIRNTVGKEITETKDFATSQAEARQTKLEERDRDAQYFTLIREGKFEEAQELLDTELKGGN